MAPLAVKFLLPASIPDRLTSTSSIDSIRITKIPYIGEVSTVIDDSGSRYLNGLFSCLH